ncbi:hypothetical protein [Endozoicomonas sp. ALB032]|uniref:hypothetical protein n=1 Tax=Endozoicomonas sp. ALB032 TaxID=3403082 RepID=UPI003BB4CE46
MTYLRPGVLSLAVAVAVSASMIATPALAGRRLQTKSVHFLSYRHAEFTQSEVTVMPAVGDDQQSIPKSINTLYIDQNHDRTSYSIHSVSFTDILYNIYGGVSTVDQFETGENDVAQKYTKILKVDNKGIFRFTHNLGEEKLVIEVRGRMTDEDSVWAVRRRLVGIKLLEPLTKIAHPQLLHAVLGAADDKAGDLGASDHYVELATIEVEKVAVNGRTFMRLIAAGDQPPELQRLGQSLFVNDDVLLAAAASAYIQVHVLKIGLQQKALNELLAHNKPVGYVVHVEGDKQLCPVPSGYPKLEVAEAPGEVIVFHGQKPNPHDLTFVENIYNLWKEAEADYTIPSAATKVKKGKVETYLYVIRSRQMAVLEEIVARHGAEEPTTLTNEDKRALNTLACYEFLQQALVSATPTLASPAAEFELTTEHIRVASLAITPTWLQMQFAKYFSFKSVLGDLLTNQDFVQSILNPVAAELRADVAYQDDPFAAKVTADMARQLIQREKILALKLRQKIEVKAEHDLARSLSLQEGLQNQLQKLQQEVAEIPALKQEVRNAREKAIKIRNIELAEALGIDHWDDAQSPEEQAIRIRERLNDKDTVKTNLAAIEGQLGITPDNENDLGARFQSIQQHLSALIQPIHNRVHILTDSKEELEDIRTPDHTKAMPEVVEKLTAVEKALKMDDLDRKEDVYDRRHAISEEIQTYITDVRQNAEEEAQRILKIIEEIVGIKVNEDDGNAERLNRVRSKLESDDVTEKMLADIDYRVRKKNIAPTYETGKLKLARLQGRLNFLVEDADELITKQQIVLLKVVEEKLNIDISENSAAEERGQHFIATLADVLKVKFRKDASLDEKKDALSTKIWLLTDEVDELYNHESVKRDRNNEIALQLNIENYKEDAPLKDQNRLITATLARLDEEVFNAGQPDVNERVAAIENELDRQMARLGPKPRYVLDRELARAKVSIEEAETELEELHRKLDAVDRKQVVFTDSTDVPTDRDKYITALHKSLKRIHARFGLTQNDNQTPEDLLNDIERFLQESEYYAEKRVGLIHQLNTNIRALKIPFEFDHDNYLEGSNYINAIRDYQASHGKDKVNHAEGELPETRRKYTQVTQFLHEHDFREMELASAKDEEKQSQAPLDTENQAIDNSKDIDPKTKTKLEHNKEIMDKIVKISKALETLEDHEASLKVIENNLGLKPDSTATHDARIDALRNKQLELGGDDGFGGKILQLTRKQQNLKRAAEGKKAELEILREALRAAEEAVENDGGPFQYSPEELKSFSEYFATHSACANKITTLLQEGSISKVELDNYIKAVRGVDGYQTVAEFEHLLGYKHGVDVPRFKVVVGILSDKGADEFMQTAFNPVTVAASHPAGMKESVVGMKEYAAAVIANYVLDDIAFENGRRTAAFLCNLQDTLTPYTNVAGLSESDLIKAIHNTLMLAHVAAVEWQLNDYWVKPSAFLVQAVTWYYTSYKPLLATHTVWQANDLSLSNMVFLYLLDLTNRGDYLHRMLIPFQHWLQGYGVDLDRTGQYAYHSGIEQVSEVGGMVMPLGKAASSVILLQTGAMLFARQHNANPHSYRSISRLTPEIVKSMGSGQGVQVPLLHRATPQKVKTLASATAGLVLGPVATVGAYAHGLISGFTYAQTFGFALASSLTFDFFMNDNKMLTQWLGGPLGRSLDKINRWKGMGETQDEFVKRTAIASPQRFNETDEAYTNRAKAGNRMHGWTRHENYLQFRDRRDRTMKMFENSWEKYFRENVPKWSFSHAESIPYSCTLGALFESGTEAPEEASTAMNAFLP